MTTTTKTKQTCSKCRAEGKYLGVFRDCSRRVEVRHLIWHCQGCGDVWQTKSRKGAEAKEAHHVSYPEDFSRDSVENLQALCRACHMAETLDAKAKKLSKELAKETDASKIYMQLLAWVVEVAKYRGSNNVRGKPDGPT